jgi:hypothetical protein
MVGWKEWDRKKRKEKARKVGVRRRGERREGAIKTTNLSGVCCENGVNQV